MVLKLDGNIRSNLCYLICVRHLSRYREVRIRFFSEKTHFSLCVRNMFYYVSIYLINLVYVFVVRIFPLLWIYLQPQLAPVGGIEDKNPSRSEYWYTSHNELQLTRENLRGREGVRPNILQYCISLNTTVIMSCSWPERI